MANITSRMGPLFPGPRPQRFSTRDVVLSPQQNYFTRDTSPLCRSLIGLSSFHLLSTNAIRGG